MLTPEQRSTLKAFILADGALSQIPSGADGSFAIAAELNKEASPAFVVWRTSVPMSEIMSNGFDWVRVDNASVGKARIWEWMMAIGSINPSKANIRAGIDEAWSGGANQSHRDAIYVHCKRSATVIEKLFATGNGTTQVPATMTYAGSVSPQDVQAARES